MELAEKKIFIKQKVVVTDDNRLVLNLKEQYM